MDKHKLYEISRSDVEGIRLHDEASTAKAAAILTEAANDELQLTVVKEYNLKRRPWDVSHAFAKAVKDVLGTSIRGRESSGFLGMTILPGIHTFEVQTLVRDYNGIHLSDDALDAFTTIQIVALCIERGVPVPSPWSEYDRDAMISNLRSSAEIIGVGSRQIKVPFGEVTLTKMGSEWGTAEIGATEDPALGILGVVQITVQNRRVKEAQAILDRLKEVLKTESIYQGRAIDSADEHPSFWDPFQIDVNSVVLSDDLCRSIQTNILYPIKWTERAIKRDPSLLKRTFIWTGDFGTGKTKTMVLMAQWAIKHGWTVLRHKAGSDDLSRTMQSARLMQPCLVLVEDADVFATSGEKMSVSKLLDEFDGMLAKGGQVITIMTTNNESDITKGMTRPGRIDGLMRFGNLDFDGVKQLVINLLGSNCREKPIPSRLFDVYDRGQAPRVIRSAPIKDDLDWEVIVPRLQEFTTAFQAEIVKRAVSNLLDVEEGGYATTENLLDAAAAITPQFELFMAASQDAPQPDPLVEQFRKIVAETARDTVGELLTESIQMDTDDGTFVLK